MKIDNFTQMAHLLTSKRLLGSHGAFDRLATCMTTYNSLCECEGNSHKEKSNKLSECNRIYRESMSIIGNFKSRLFEGCADNTISFFMNGQHMKTIGR